MNLDDYIAEVTEFATDEAVDQINQFLSSWKDDDTDVHHLAESMERLFGNSWIGSRDTHSHLYNLWDGFKNDTIQGIGGMTLNERLYHFGLIERYKGCVSESDRASIYAKVAASL